jgi:hypothetical protein
MRDYQWIKRPSGPDYGNGWNVVAVFDPDANQVRIRSYRIDDAENYRTQWQMERGLAVTVDQTHDGDVEETRILDRDFDGSAFNANNNEVVITGPGTWCRVGAPGCP